MEKNREEQLAYLRNLKDEDIDFSDIPDSTGTEIWRPNPLFFKPRKTKINFSLDMDIATWLRKQKNASGFINELIKKEMLKHA
jgi:hypothetical protein